MCWRKSTLTLVESHRAHHGRKIRPRTCDKAVICPSGGYRMPGSPERKHHFSCLPQDGCRCIGLVMKAHARRKLIRSWPAGGYDYADLGPPPRDLAGQVCPAHRAGHADVCEKQPNAGTCLEELQGLVGISGFEHPVSGVQEHAGCPHSLEHVVIDDQDCGVGGGIGH
jgi:hypothetical protein